jgi:hypothetical protein
VEILFNTARPIGGSGFFYADILEVEMKKLILILLCLGLTGCSTWYKDYGLEKNQLLSREAIPQLMEALTNNDPKTRRSALRYIARQRELSREAIPIVVNIARNDKDDKVKIYATKTLAQIMPNTQENINIISGLVKSNTDPEIAGVAHRVLQRIKNKEVAGEVDSPTFKDSEPPSDIAVELTPMFQFYNGYKVQHPSRSYKMVPIQLRIENHSNLSIDIDMNSIELFNIKGNPIKRLSLENAKQRLFYGPGYFARSIVTGFPVVSQVRAGKANGKISKHCENTVLIASPTPPGETKEGYLYYDCPSRPRAINGWRMNFSYTQEEQIFDVQYVFGEGGKITKKQPSYEATPVVAEGKSLKEKLIQLKHLREADLITLEEYEAKKSALLEEL